MVSKTSAKDRMKISKSMMLDTKIVEKLDQPSDGGEMQANTSSGGLGPRLRAYRQSRKLGLKDLAALASVSVGILSQIERGMNVPSLRTVEKIRNALDLPIGFFFDEERPIDNAREDDAICRSDRRPVLKFGRQGLSKQLLHHAKSRVFEMMIIDLPPRSSSDFSSYPSEKGALVMEGKITFSIDGESSELNVGDSLLFDGTRPHQLQNNTDFSAKIMWIVAKLPNEFLL